MQSSQIFRDKEENYSRMDMDEENYRDRDYAKKLNAEDSKLSKQEGNSGTSGGVYYIPPFKLKEIHEDKSSVEYQRLTWDALKKSINGLVNKVNATNIKNIIPELFGEIDKRVQFLIEGLFALRKAKFQGYPAKRPELDLVQKEDQFTCEISLQDTIDPEIALDIFKPDPNFVENEKNVDFEETGHKLLKIELEPGQEMELCIMLLECCSQERIYLRKYCLLGQRLCMINKVYQENFERCFVQQYSMIHRLETNKLRNVAHFFCELWEHLGIRSLNHRLSDPTMQESFDSIFPKDNPNNTRFAINFFTQIGLGGITENLREYLKNIIMQQHKSSSSSEEDTPRKRRRH
nr:pre-mRNA-splicing factor CWC22 homolog [Ipomoea batatas]